VLTPSTIAQSLQEAADRLEAAAGRRHAPALQRRRVAQAWRIAATLARWDAAVRAADPGADVLWQSAQRQTQVLAAKLEEFPQIPVPAGLTHFCRTVNASHLTRLPEFVGIFRGRAERMRW